MGLLQTDYPVTICTDDPLIFHTTLSQESDIVMGCLWDHISQDDIPVYAGKDKWEWIRGIHERARNYALGPVN